MWFEKLDTAGLPDKAAEGLHAVIYYYFTAFATSALVWVLWRLFELRSYLWQNILALILLFGLMFLVINGLRGQKLWARVVLLLEYGLFFLASAYFFGLSLLAIGTKYSGELVTAVSVYLMYLILWAYGIYQLAFDSKIKTIDWK